MKEVSYARMHAVPAILGMTMLIGALPQPSSRPPAMAVVVSTVRTPEPDIDTASVRVEVMTYEWGRGVERIDSAVVRARRGDDLFPMLRHMYGSDRMGDVVGVRRVADRNSIWISVSPGFTSFPERQRGPWSEAPDSILLSTTIRSLGSKSYHAGHMLKMRVVPDALPRIRPGNIRSLKTLRRTVESETGENIVHHATAIVIATVLSIDPDSSRSPDTMRAATLTLSPSEFLKGHIPSGRIRAFAEWGIATDSTWAPIPRSTAFRRGDRAVFFLRPARGAALAWQFDSFNYALFAERESLTFSILGRGLPTDQLRERIADLSMRPFTSLVVGRITDASGRGIDDLRISIGDGCPPVVTRNGGDFKLRHIPIGYQVVRVEGGGRFGEALVGVNDETPDSLAITMD